MPGGTFALSSLPLAFCFVQDKVNCAAREDALGRKKKTDILAIKRHFKKFIICRRQLLS